MAVLAIGIITTSVTPVGVTTVTSILLPSLSSKGPNFHHSYQLMNPHHFKMIRRVGIVLCSTGDGNTDIQRDYALTRSQMVN
jgi:hypothetical protein